MPNKIDPEKVKRAGAVQILGRLVVMNAPLDVIQPLRNWINKLEGGEDGVNSETVGIEESVNMGLINVKEKN
ncbi:MAG: hypothetical protein ACXACX_09240 [Candidatus Hodarchaeales archaeon]|jgi:hypothetical protein